MPIGNKSVGRDLSFTITTLDGQLNITPDLVGSYTTDPNSEWKTWLPITGIEENAVLPMSWGGTIELIRKGPVIDTFWALLEAAYYNGVSIQPSVMIETIQEPDGSTTQWSYIGTLFRLTKAGDWKGNEFVMQQLEWRATRRNQV
jgi:hypothetical protein